MIDDLTMRRLEAIAEDLRELDASLVRGGRSEHFIQSKSGADGDFEIHANAEGLVYLANQMLQLARSRVEGKHLHFDAAGMLEKSDRPFLVCYKAAEWDNDGSAR